MAASARSTQPASAGLVDVFQLWQPDAGLSGRRLSRLRSSQTLPAQSVEAARAWCTEHLPCHGFRGARCSTASTRAASATAVGLTMKLVGKPDAGNRHVRFDERGQETECCHMAQATAPVLDSTGRREFMTLIGGAAAWPIAARAQQAGKLATIGFLGTSTPADLNQRTAAFVQRLRELGWIEGRSIAIEYRWAEGRDGRVAEVAADLVR